MNGSRRRQVAQAQDSPKRRLHPGLCGLLFLLLSLALTAAGVTIWILWLRLTAGLSPEAALRRIDVLTIYVAMTLAAVAATWLCARYLDGELRPHVQLPLARRPLAHGLLGIAAGVATQGLIYLAGLLTGVYAARVNAGPGPEFWRYVLTMVFVALGEEIVHRGYLLRRWTDWLGRWPAAAATSLLFGAAHLMSPGAGVMSTLGICAHGMVYAWVVQASGSLWPAVGLHWAWNVMEGGVLGLPNSGRPEPFALIATAVNGPAWWTGGEFGPEAGVISLMAVPLAVLILWPAARPAYRPPAGRTAAR